MDYTRCPLYNLRSKKTLRYLIRLHGNRLPSQGSVAAQTRPYVTADDRPRLIEAPSEEIKAIQSRIKSMLCRIDVPNYVFSGIRGRSYVGNARIHAGVRFLYKVDLTCFFPSVKRETVYQFFVGDLRCSPDVAKALTNLTTVDIHTARVDSPASVADFLSRKGITTTNHLISGSPASPVLSYLANRNMFDELAVHADRHDVTMSVYVDDITFSSPSFISREFKEKVRRIVRRYGYQTRQEKVKSYPSGYPKLVTGVIIDRSGRLAIRNRLSREIAEEFRRLREDPSDGPRRNRLRGLVSAARQVNPRAFQSIRRFVFAKPDSLG